MPDITAELLKRADLEIIEYNIHHRKSMNSCDRSFPFYVMSYLQKGEACLRINGEVHKMGPGSIIMVPPNTRHDHYKEDTGETTFLWWHFKFSVARVVDAVNILRIPVVSRMSEKERFEEAFYRFYNSSSMNSLSSLLMHRAWGLELMALLIEDLVSGQHISMGNHISESFLEIFYEIIDLGRGDISLNYFSEKYHMNGNYISNRFKKYFGMTPISMRRRLVFEHSKELLRTTSLGIGEIADLLGFDSAFSFTHFFSALAGISPSGFRSS